MTVTALRRFNGLPAARLVPGLLLAVTIALAATFIAENYGGPQLLYALFFGIAFNFLAGEPRTQPGIELASGTLLRFGVALLGARITWTQITALGVAPVLLVLAGVVGTIAVGALLARRLGRSLPEGLLTGGAVAICGASAALAISAVLPKSAEQQRFTLLTVVGVTALSTLAMILYPALAKTLGLDATAAGLFLGGTIHDVAQVVGAGYIISVPTGDNATLVKLFRVATLVPVVLVFSWLFRRQHQASNGTRKPPLLPAFLIAFVLFVAGNSFGLIPPQVVDLLGHVSRWCLVIAIAGLGVKISFQQLAELGWRPIAMLVGETLFLAVWILAGTLILKHVPF